WDAAWPAIRPTEERPIGLSFDEHRLITRPDDQILAQRGDLAEMADPGEHSHVVVHECRLQILHVVRPGAEGRSGGAIAFQSPALRGRVFDSRVLQPTQ